MFALRVIAVFVCLSPVLALAQSDKPHVVMLIAEREYQTKESLITFASEHLSDFRVTFVFESPDDRNQLVGVSAVESADVLLVSMRRRTLPTDQLDRVRAYVESGKPVIGIRTASHAFSLRNQEPPQGRAVWPEFDRDVFGGNYTNHHGNKLTATIKLAPDRSADVAPLLKGLESIGAFRAGGSLYRVSPLANGAQAILVGQVEGAAAEPVAWTFQRADGGKSFYTSLGHVDDFAGDVLPVLLANAIRWTLE